MIMDEAFIMDYWHIQKHTNMHMRMRAHTHTHTHNSFMAIQSLFQIQTLFIFP